MLKGHAAPEVTHAYARAYELAQRLGDPTQRFAVFASLWRCYLSQAKLHMARELGDNAASAQR
ncbi:MAG: hypothetical protein FJZ47_01760 [Candidatus Tectomicrobia bacterium]|uniref:Uncharacterized protein n=1 Tax=Tectimicrobiota bacterium TaxID=2528274 RepID=A0A937VXT3_UNCTE|nr:hypothetical protein [Candidatus Tectomicrobia bacterium]